jgi:ribosomal protein L7Ae-like RNA K-turn-binding protein
LSGMDKISSYIGFAVKSGSVIIGGDNIEKAKKPPRVILVCESASDRLKKKMQSLGDAEIIAVENLEELSHIGGCKALAVTDQNLAKAIIRLKRCL